MGVLTGCVTRGVRDTLGTRWEPAGPVPVFKVLRKQNKYSEAIAAYRRCIELASPTAEVVNNMGLAQLAFGDARAAVNSFRSILATAPTNFNALFNLGLALQHVQPPDHKEAAQHLKRALKLSQTEGGSGESGELIFHLGVSLQLLGSLDEALKMYKRLATIAPAHPNLYLNVGAVYQAKGMFRDAIHYYARVLERTPDDVSALNNYGACLWQLEDGVGSMQAFRRGLALKPDMPDLLINLGVAFYEEGNVPQVSWEAWYTGGGALGRPLPSLILHNPP